MLIDSGVRRGTDIFKALALGADAVGIGRPYVWGLGAFGEDGVDKVIELMLDEFRIAMRQTRYDRNRSDRISIRNGRQGTHHDARQPSGLWSLTLNEDGRMAFVDMSFRTGFVPWLVIAIFAGLVLLQGPPAAAQPSTVHFTVSGTSTIRGWTCTVSGTAQVTPGSSEPAPGFATGV